MEEGLPSLWVYDIIQAKDGAIWFATDNGVSRFDGYEFEYFGVAEGLPHPDVFVLHEDDKGRIWCGVMNNELCYIETGKVIRSKQADALANFFDGSAIVQGIFTKNGELFLTYKKNGLVRIDRTGKIEHIGHEAGLHVFLTGKNENLIGPVKSGIEQVNRDITIFVYDESGLLEKRVSPISGLSYAGIVPRSSSYGKLDSLKVIHAAYVFLFQGDTVNVHSPKARINQIVKSQEWTWNGSQTDGIHLTNTESTISHILPGKNLTPELCDNDGNVWVVEMGKGVHCFKPIKIRNYSNGEELHEGLISTIASSNNHLAIGYESGLTECLSINKHGEHWLNESGGYVLGAHWVNRSLYIHSTRELKRLNRQGQPELIKQSVTLRPNLPVLCAKRTLKYKPNIYSMIGSPGICLWNAETRKILLSSFKDESFRLQDQLIDNQHNIWATSEKGIYLFDVNTGKLIQYITNASIAGIVQTNNGDIWCSDAKGGILKFIPSTKKIVKINLGKTVNETFLKHLRKDKNGVIWGTSNKGLFRINPATKKVELIKKSDGLLSNLLTDISIDDELVFVSSSKGISSLNINTSFKSANAPALIINRVRLNGKIVNPKYLLKLSHDENNLEFRFKAIGFTTPGMYNYRYRLKGLNDEWQYTSELKALFLSVPNGAYQFQLESFDPRGGWSVRKMISVSISPPFWETWWFIGGLMLLIAFTAYFFYKRRIRKLEQTNQLKNEIKKFQQHAMTAQMNPHFIFNSMNSIQRFIIENERLIANEYLVKFSGLMRLTLENSKSIWVPIEDELKTLKLYLELESLRFKNKMNWKIEVADSVDQSLKIPTLLIQPFVENSIWHGLMHKPEGGIVEIRINNHDGQIVCEVLDNGVGRESAQKLESKEHKTMKSTGLSITKRRLELLHDESRTAFLFSIEDRKSNQNQVVGTRVYFSIPTVE